MTNNTVCLCGSTRFLEEFHRANVELTKRGLTVLTISMALPKEEATAEEEALKELLDLVHLNKILRADAVLVVGDGYLGRSTAREVLWAHMQGKPILCAVDCHYDWDVIAGSLRCGSWKTYVVSKAREKLGLPR